ncbi:MAG: glycosyltransferase [Gammaproteobacteria bacterium]|nr:glycosyltransferase [Gammaproteobacteria bacterium]
MILIVPGDPDQRTGGYLYDARAVQELRRLGWTVRVVGLDGRFPETDERARGHLLAALAALPDGARALIDGLALGGAPEAAEAHADRLRISALVHHPLADETGLPDRLQRHFLATERRALAACRLIVVTSRFGARRLRELGLSGIEPVVAEPGVDPAPLAGPVERWRAGNTPTGTALLCVASLTPRKGQEVLIQALATLKDRDWSLELAGSDQRDPAYAARIESLIARQGLADRIRMLGELDHDALNVAYGRAEVVIVPSHYEGYGMVVTEALARGLPLITTQGGALAETVPPDCSLRVDPSDPAALGGALARWLDDERVRSSLYRQALARRRALPSWAETGRRLAAALNAEAGAVPVR